MTANTPRSEIHMARHCLLTKLLTDSFDAQINRESRLVSFRRAKLVAATRTREEVRQAVTDATANMLAKAR